MLEQSREEELRRLATVVLDSNDAILLVDFSGNIRAWNRGAERIYGYSEAEALKMNIIDLVPSDMRDDTLAMLEKLQRGEEVSSYETRRVTKAGRVLDIWLTITMLRDDQGKPNMVATTERDITERRRATARMANTLKELQDKTEQLETSTEELEVMNEELRSTNEALDEANRRIQDTNSEVMDYSRIIVNTLESPLKTLGDGLTALKNMGNDPGDRRQIGALLQKEGEVAAVAEDLSMLLYASRVEAHPVMVNLSDMVRTMIGELEASEPGSRVKTIVPSGIIVYADKNLLGVAVRNILSNSWGHVRKNGSGMIVFYARIYGSRGILVLYDNRREFDPVEFNCFSRPPAGEAGLTGTDLGLLVAKKIFDRLDGQFWVDYEHGKGLSFCITLPTSPVVVI